MEARTNTWTIPSIVEFEKLEVRSTIESLDELAALNTALCFLCSLNADAQAIETFLTLHPAALLLDGTGLLPEESALYIVEDQRSTCRCIAADCRQNRRQVWTVLGRGFAHYQQRARQKDLQWDLCRPDLVRLEGDIRVWRAQEQALRNRVVEGCVELQTLESRKKVWKCAAQLDYEIGVGQVHAQSVRREHAMLVKQITQARKTQFALLNRVFHNVGRHPCTT